MASLLERRLVVVTGKGGTGKTTVACALGLIAAQRGRRTIVVELGAQRRLAALFGRHGIATGEEVELRERLWSISIDPDRVMIEWLGAVTGRLPARLLASSATFHYFAAAAPGARELATMVKLCELARERYDTVVLDAPATGHALGALRSPQTFSAIVRVGPLADSARAVRELLQDPARSAYAAVTHGSEMAVIETLELEDQLRRLLDRDLDAVFVNGALPQRFSAEEIARLQSALEQAGGRPGRADATDAAILAAAAASARSVHRRARVQRSQIARLRRQRFSGGAPPRVLTIPFQFVPELDLACVERIASRLARVT